MRQVVTYVRVSTEDQLTHGHSIETQRQVLADYAHGHELEIVKTFEESHSAYRRGQRPVYAALLAYLRRHRSVSGVLVYKLDRLARNLSDFSALAEMENVSIISATEALPDGPTGRFAATIHAAASRLYSDQLRERVKHAAHTKLLKGGFPGPAPRGYVNDKQAKVIRPDPDVAPRIRFLFETYAREDISLSRLPVRAAEWGLKTRTGRTFQKGEVHYILRNPIYHGVMHWGGQVCPGSHEPIISKELFDHVQQPLQQGSSPLRKRSFAYLGLMTCGHCGCKITASRIKRQYTYYHCTHGRGKCPQAFLREEALANLFFPIVEGVHIDGALATKLLAQIQAEGGRRMNDAERRIRVAQARLKELQDVRDKAYEDKLRGALPEARWVGMDARWAGKQDELNAQIEAIESQQGPACDEAEATSKPLERAPQLYIRQSHTERVPLLQVLLSNSVLEDGKLVPVYKTVFDLMAEGVSRSNWLVVCDYNSAPILSDVMNRSGRHFLAVGV